MDKIYNDRDININTTDLEFFLLKCQAIQGNVCLFEKCEIGVPVVWCLCYSSGQVANYIVNSIAYKHEDGIRFDL